MRKTIEIEDRETTRALLGAGDCHLRRVRETLGVEVAARGDLLHLSGDDGSVERCARAFLGMLRVIRKSQRLDEEDVQRILDSVTAGDDGESGDRRLERKGSGPHTSVHPLTPGQARYMEAMATHDVVFAIGPAGTGKTYLAVASALESLSADVVSRLVLVRPAVEAGERLGFLPGDVAEKVNPYLRPLYDALHDMLNAHQLARYVERGVVEIAPLAFMRGRTLNNAFVILDEAQNTTPKQMKMFLTRLGRDARAVITGDVTQVDLPAGDLSGLAHAWDILHGVDGVAFVTLEKQDIVRHPLVQRIVDAYDQSEGSGK
ncbi:MAG: PhoH family protein [Planctomycetota bacterium]|nr:PhoH family protein [Planctomycetota bacterium]